MKINLYSLKMDVERIFDKTYNEGYTPVESSRLTYECFSNREINKLEEIIIRSTLITLLISFNVKEDKIYYEFIGRIFILCSEIDIYRELNTFDLELVNEELKYINDFWNMLEEKNGADI